MWPCRNQVGQPRPCQLKEGRTRHRNHAQTNKPLVHRDRASDVPGRPILDKTTTSAASLGHTRSNRVLNGEGGTKVSEPWLSAEEIATHLGVTKDTVYAWIADKAMPAHKIGRLWKFQASEVDTWVRSGGTGGR